MLQPSTYQRSVKYANVNQAVDFTIRILVSVFTDLEATPLMITHDITMSEIIPIMIQTLVVRGRIKRPVSYFGS